MRFPVPASGPLGNRQMLADGQALEHLAFLRNITEAGNGPRVNGDFRNIDAVEADKPAATLRPADNQLEQRALADAVASDDGDGFAGGERKIELFHHGGRPPAAGQALDLKHRRHPC